ncbi:N-acetylmuramic acid 6-phosphate etherase [Lacticaseibacillus rhamnosus]|nr:N-acetylmuramic acid 6-phosphate etherase [Lacticaseibacillus rhamnosus]
MTTPEIVALINHEDAKIAPAIATQTAQIAAAIDEASQRYNRGGRLIYAGAGTSGRLGVLDAAELVPTYGIPPERAVGLIAGGMGAMFKSVEGAEDSAELAEHDLRKLNLNANDTVIGIAASGRTPYAIGALTYAQQVKALAISVTCVAASLLADHADIAIAPVVGPEVITGSTRMKAGTAQKMVLNMLSTGVMIRAGKVFGNLMIDVLPTNAKLVDRAQRIITETTGVSATQAASLLEAAANKVPVAIVMAKTGLDAAAATQVLAAHDGVISDVLTAWEAEHGKSR